MRSSRWRDPGAWRNALLLLVMLLSLAAGLGMRQPSPPDEPRFALAARDMVESGQWLFPHRGREFYAEKPPVFMWLQAAAYRTLGDLKVAFLLPSLLAAMLTLWLTWDLTRRLWNPRVARYAALALFVCLQFGLQAKRGQIDMVLVAMTTLSLWALLRHLLQGPQWPMLWLGMFAAGLGTVTKGVGFLPLLVLLPWWVLKWRQPRTRTVVHAGEGWRWMLGVLAFVAGTGVWLVPMLIAVVGSHDPTLQQYASELLLKQTGKRYADAWHHVQPAWYYLQVMATLWLPGSLLLPWLLPAWWRRLRRFDHRLWLLLGWSLLVLVFFSASPGKREVYIFPMLPALCVAAAPLLPGLLKRAGVRRVLEGYLLVVALMACAMSLAALAGWSDWADTLAGQRGIQEATVQTFLLWLGGFGLIALVMVLWAQMQRVGSALVLTTAALWTVYGLGLAPAVDADSSASALMQRVATRIGPDAELGMVAWREQNLLQSDRPTVDFGFKRAWHEQWAEAGMWLQHNPQTRWLLVLEDALSTCVDPKQAIDVGQSNRRQWVLVPAVAMQSHCVTTPFDGEAERVR